MQRIRFDSESIPAREPPPLSFDEIHVWHWAIKGDPKPRAVTAIAHARLRALLSAYSGSTRFEIARTERGKPHAPALAGLEFNVSHAGGRVLLAFARARPVGVDIERIERRLDPLDLAHRFFARDEAGALERMPEPARQRAFLELWTCKEAVLKAIGAGIAFGLDRVAFALVDGTPSGLAGIAEEAGGDWRIAQLEPAPGFVGALAWRGADARVRIFEAAFDA